MEWLGGCVPTWLVSYDVVRSKLGGKKLLKEQRHATTKIGMAHFRDFCRNVPIDKFLILDLRSIHICEYPHVIYVT